MPSRRVIKAVLNGFLGTYTSRYSQYQGYWLLPYLIDKTEEFQFDLLSGLPRLDESIPSYAAAVARKRFGEQAQKHHVRELIRSAALTIKILPSKQKIGVNGHILDGHQVDFLATAISDRGVTYQSACELLLAPHSNAERKSCGTDSLD